MPMIFGRLIGAVTAGIAAGPFGVIFGFVVGYLVDQLLRERQVRRILARFYRDPLSPLPRRLDAASLALIAVTVHLSTLAGPVRRGQVELLRVHLRHRLKTAAKLRAADRAIDEAIRLQHALNIPALSLCLRARMRGRPAELEQPAVTALFAEVVRGAPETPDVRNRIAAVCEYAAIDAEQVLARGDTGPAAGFSDPRSAASADPAGSAAGEAAGLDSRACAILGVSREASAGEIKAVFRRLAGQFHPDSLCGLDDEQRARSTEAFIRIKGAYDTLMEEIEGGRCPPALGRTARSRAAQSRTA
ncbi:DnaJ domain-containing protein [Salinispira pacifica]